MRRIPPDPVELLQEAVAVGKPLAIVLAGHNGSGKSTFWYDKLADSLRIPLINADRLTLSILPPATNLRPLPTWAVALRDENEKWQRVSQEGVQLYLGLIMDQQLPFAFETVFSHLQRQPDGSYQSKIRRSMRFKPPATMLCSFSWVSPQRICPSGESRCARKGAVTTYRKAS